MECSVVAAALGHMTPPLPQPRAGPDGGLSRREPRLLSGNTAWAQPFHDICHPRTLHSSSLTIQLLPVLNLTQELLLLLLLLLLPLLLILHLTLLPLLLPLLILFNSPPQDYLLRKASRSMIDAWLTAHSLPPREEGELPGTPASR